MGHRRFTRQVVINPTMLGLNGATLDAEKTSNTFSIANLNELTIYVNATRVAYTALILKVDVTPEDGSVSNWYSLNGQASAAGVTTNVVWTDTFTTSASVKYAVTLPEFGTPSINGRQARVKVSSTAGGASDTAIVTVIATYND
jgi:hypothetical protein